MKAAGFTRAGSAAALLLALAACSGPWIEKVEKSSTGREFVSSSSPEGFYLVSTSEKLETAFRERPAPGSQPPKPLYSKQVESSVSLLFGGGGKLEVLAPRFILFQPGRAAGLVEQTPSLLMRGDQNLGKPGLLLPLYKVGCSSCDWAVYDREAGRLFSLGGPGIPALPLDLPLRSEGAGTLYSGDRHYASVSPSHNVAATLSKSGRMSVFAFPSGKTLLRKEGVFTFVLHPSAEGLYYSDREGVHAVGWKGGVTEREELISREPARTLRVSPGGCCLFALSTGGIGVPRLFRLAGEGMSGSKEVKVPAGLENAEDWVFTGEGKLAVVTNGPEGGVVKVHDLSGGKDREAGTQVAGSRVEVLCFNSRPSIGVLFPGASKEGGAVHYLDSAGMRFERFELPGPGP